MVDHLLTQVDVTDKKVSKEELTAEDSDEIGGKTASPTPRRPSPKKTAPKKKAAAKDDAAPKDEAAPGRGRIGHTSSSHDARPSNGRPFAFRQDERAEHVGLRSCGSDASDRGCSGGRSATH